MCLSVSVIKRRMTGSASDGLKLQCTAIATFSVFSLINVTSNFATVNRFLKLFTVGNSNLQNKYYIFRRLLNTSLYYRVKHKSLKMLPLL